MSTTQGKQARNRLTRARLDSYCWHMRYWPPRRFLESLEADAGTLSATNQVSWKTFQRLNERLPSLRLAASKPERPPQRFDNLVNRAIARLKEAPQASLEHARPLIQWLVKMDHPRVREFGAVNGVVAVEIRKQIRLYQDVRREKKREATRFRKEQQRLRKKLRQKSVT